VHTYETVFITVPTLTDDEESALVGGLAQIIADGGGTLAANDRMGRRRLAYAIGKCDDGVYTRFLYDSEPAVPKELERRIRISDKVLRYLTVRLEPDWAVAAKEQAVRDAQARAEAEAARAAMPPTEVSRLDEDEEEPLDEDAESDEPGPAWAETAPPSEEQA